MSLLLPASTAATWTAVVGATPSPDPGLRQGVDPLDVTPGVLGFLVIFAAALACIPLFRSMTKKVRRIEYLAQREGTLPADEAEQGERADRPQPPGGVQPPTAPPPTAQPPTAQPPTGTRPPAGPQPPEAGRPA